MLYSLDALATGLHSRDAAKLLEGLHALVDQGNTVILIEDTLEVMRQRTGSSISAPKARRAAAE
jgi:excinuclease UvrABC ATPase subunit